MAEAKPARGAASGGALARALQAEAGLARRAALVALLGPLIWLAQAFLVALAIAGMVTGQGGLGLLPAAIGFAALALLRSGAEAAALALSQRLSARVRQDLRARLIGHALRRAPGGAEEDPGGLASLMGEGIAQIGPWVERYRPAALRARILPLVVLALALSQSWAAALALLLTGPLIPLFMALVGWAAEAASRAHLVEQGALNRVLIDRVAALVDLRLMGAAGRAGEDLAAQSESLRARTMKVLRLAFLSSAVLEFFAALGVALVAVHTGLSLLGLIGWGAWGAGLTPFGGIFVLLIAPEFYQPLRDLASAWHDRASAEAAGARIDAELAQTDLILGAGLPGKAPVGPLAWRGITLGSGAERRIALPDGVVAPGEAVALMGPSGAGKTSLLMALAGLSAAGGGVVSLGGVVQDPARADDLRAAMALIPQTPRFPDQRLRDWLAPGDTDPALLWQALEAAGVAVVVRGLPQGLDTVLGESGGGVSGGEARRLMLARALLARPALVLADEPTADLDAESAARVADALLALRDAGVGLLVATHDAGLAARLDRVIDIGAPA